jgi:hypothetical protein
MPTTVLPTSVIADPHVTNFQGKEFFFYGAHDECFCLISSSNFYLNVRLYDTNSKAPIMTEAALVVGNEQVGLNKYFVSSLEERLSYIIAQKRNDESLVLPCGHEEKFDTGLVNKKGDSILGCFRVAHDHVHIDTGNFITKIYRCTDKDHNLIGPPHLDIYHEVGEIGVLTQGVWPHGLVGQSINFEIEENYQGEEMDYRVPDLFSHEFKYDRFKQQELSNKKWFVGTDKKSISM